MQNIYYENHLGDIINLIETPYRLQTGDFYNYTWGYDFVDGNSRYGGNVRRFRRGAVEKQFILSIQAKDKMSYYQALNDFLEITEVDVINKKHGRLYVGEQYLECYIIEVRKTLWESGANVLDCHFKIVTEYPFWKTESKVSFDVRSEQVVSSGSKKYPNRYAYRYAGIPKQTSIVNRHFVDSDVQIHIHGPAVYPSLVIGGNTYAVNTIIVDGETLIIDTASKTVIKTQVTGNEVNMFNSRNKEHDIFKPLPPGTQNIAWDGSFAFDIIIYEERSEPKWVL